jgi:hypothetical protein
MLELASYGVTGLVGILLVAFCFACKDESASFSDKASSGLAHDAELRDSRPVKQCTCAPNDDPGPQQQKHEGDLNG